MRVLGILGKRVKVLPDDRQRIADRLYPAGNGTRPIEVALLGISQHPLAVPPGRLEQHAIGSEGGLGWQRRQMIGHH